MRRKIDHAQHVMELEHLIASEQRELYPRALEMAHGDARLAKRLIRVAYLRAPLHFELHETPRRHRPVVLRRRARGDA